MAATTPNSTSSTATINNAFQRIRTSQSRNAKIDKSLMIADDELLNFTESIRNFYEAGVSIKEILVSIKKSTPNKNFGIALGLMADDIENGKQLSEAMERFPAVFGADYRSLIAAAEKSGRWTRKRDRNGELREGILDMLIAYNKRRNGAREKIKSGLMYPAIIAVGIIITIVIFSFYVMPALKQIFMQIGPANNLGILTKFMFWFSDFAEQYWWSMPIVLIGSAVMAISYWKSGGKKIWMQYQLKLPILGELFVRMNLAETIWLMGTLFCSGMTPQEVLSICKESARNDEISISIEQAKTYLFQGISFCDALKRAHWIFDGQTFMVVSSAQKNGQLGSSLQSYAGQLFEKVDQGIDRTVKLIEPIMLVIAGVVVGMIIISFYSGLSAAVGNLAGSH